MLAGELADCLQVARVREPAKDEARPRAGERCVGDLLAVAVAELG
jgi:hypothetical protein